LETIAPTGMIEGKRARGRRRTTLKDWISTSTTSMVYSNEILKICQERS